MRVLGTIALAGAVALAAPLSALADGPQRDSWADIGLTIDGDGVVKDTRVIKSSDDWVGAAAIDTIKRWRFRKTGREVHSVVHVKVCTEQEPSDPTLSTEECRQQRAASHH